jgi:hypothetical protein
VGYYKIIEEQHKPWKSYVSRVSATNLTAVQHYVKFAARFGMSSPVFFPATDKEKTPSFRLLAQGSPRVMLQKILPHQNGRCVTIFFLEKRAKTVPF